MELGKTEVFADGLVAEVFILGCSNFKTKGKSPKERDRV